MPASLDHRVAKLEKAPDYRFLKHVKVVPFLEALEVANVSYAKADEVQFSCPFPGHSSGDESPSAYMNDGSKNPAKATRWFCHGCKRKGNAVTFLSDHMHISRMKASRWIKEHWAPGFDKPIGGINAEFDERWEQYEQQRTRTVDELPVLDWDDYRERFGVDWFYYAENYRDEPDVAYMLDRGFTAGDLDAWDIGYDDISDRMTIPVVDHLGRLVGVKGRAWQKGRKPKYMGIGDTTKVINRHGKAVYGFEPYEKSLVVFGINWWGKQRVYVLCEGEIDMMSFWKMGIPALCVSGSYLSWEQARIIRDYADEVVLYLDNDSAGGIGVWGTPEEERDEDSYIGAVEMLENFIRVRIVKPHLMDANDLMRRGNTARVKQLIETARPSFAVRRRGMLV